MRRGASDFIQSPGTIRASGKIAEPLRGTGAAVARRQRDEELHEAREIQDSLLPKKLPKVAGMT